MDDVRDEVTTDAALIRRRDKWVAAKRGRTIEPDEAGWMVARELGVLVMRRRYLRGLMDHLEDL
jgi:hypothetical protein